MNIVGGSPDPAMADDVIDAAFLDRYRAICIAASQFDDEQLGALRHVADPPADEAVTRYFESEVNPAGATSLMKLWAAAAPHSNESSAVLSKFVDHHAELPEWADRTFIRLGQQVFERYLPQFGVSLWLASIPAGYAGKRDVIVLERTGQMMRAPERRFLETGQFVLDVMTDGALEPEGIGSSDIRHVRLMHASVRYMLREESDELKRPDWDDADGLPLNQQALLATMFTFSVVGIRSLRRMGVCLTAAESEAYVHLWCVVGHLLGIRSDLLPLDVATSETVWDAIRRLEYEPSDAGRALTRTAIDTMKEMIPGRIGDGLAVSGIRFLLDTPTCELLGVPRADWTRVLWIPGRWAGRITTVFHRDSRTGRRISGWVGRHIFEQFIEANRSGDRPKFDVPSELRRQLRN